MALDTRNCYEYYYNIDFFINKTLNKTLFILFTKPQTRQDGPYSKQDKTLLSSCLYVL